jgi:hypothetical protein
MVKLFSPARAAMFFGVAIGAAGVHLATSGTFVPAPLKHAPVHVRRNPDATPERGHRNQLISSNWSGYAVAHYLTGKAYTSARLTWVVPSVSYGSSTDSTGSSEYSSNWVGIGGFCENSFCTRVDNTLIQLGTEQDAAPNGATQYYAWYEMLPQFPIVIPLTINPGDTITATLSCGNTCSQNFGQRWTLTMQDGAQSWSKQVSYKSSKSSAEWIEEAPYSGGVLPLADFRTANFVATGGADGQTPSLSVAQNGLQMEDPWGQTSNLSSATSLAQFNMCWGFETFTSCSEP